MAMCHNFIIFYIPGAIKSDCMSTIHLFWLARALILYDVTQQNPK